MVAKLPTVQPVNLPNDLQHANSHTHPCTGSGQGRIGVEQFSPDIRLDSLGIDSLAMAELLFVIEDEFHVTFSEERESMQTVDDLVRFVQRSAVPVDHVD